MNILRTASKIAFILAFFVVILGAFTRLTDAGLGCPDWPGCYGKLVLPSTDKALLTAQSEYPNTPIEPRKAWTEMAHRYAAGSLVFLVLLMGFEVLRHRLQGIRLPWALPLCLLILISCQALLGMWTVTFKLLPLVVMGHLLGGMLIFTCLGYFCWQLHGENQQKITQNITYKWKKWINLLLVIVFCQMALGGWVSANYAGIACVGFPKCNGQWLVPLHFSDSFHRLLSVGVNYQGGILDNGSRVTIQIIHRIGALITATYVLLLIGTMIWRIRVKLIRKVALIAMIVLLLQFCLGIANVVYLLPLWVAVAHNGMAALLLFSCVSLRYLFSKEGFYVRNS